MKIYGEDRITNEQASLTEMEESCGKFFTKTPGRKRETYTVHRGFLIVRNTTDMHCGPGGVLQPRRMTAVYVFLPEGHGDDSPRPDLSCVSGCVNLGSIYQAKRYIDQLLAHGNYEYGWQCARVVGV